MSAGPGLHSMEQLFQDKTCSFVASMCAQEDSKAKTEAGKVFWPSTQLKIHDNGGNCKNAG
jgi:CxxC motif-containing protein (DUF1111 family)